MDNKKDLHRANVEASAGDEKAGKRAMSLYQAVVIGLLSGILTINLITFHTIARRTKFGPIRSGMVVRREPWK